MPPRPSSRHSDLPPAPKARDGLRAAPGAAPVTEPVLPIAQLTARLGASSEDEVRALVGDVDPAELIARGVRVETGRVTREVLHVVRGAEGFFAASTPSQRETLRISPQVLRVLAWSAAQGDRDWRRLVAQRSLGRGARSASATHDTAMRAQARAHRDQLADVLGAVHAGDDVTRRRITAATQPTASGEVDTGPGQALQALVSIGRASLTHADPGVATRRDVYGLTASWLDACARLADDALAAERAASKAGADTPGQQSRVDLWDGRNLALLERVVRAFARAHAIDATIPTMPLSTLGALLGRRRARTTTATPDAPKPADKAPTG